VTAPALDFGTDDDRYLAELAELVAIPTVAPNEFLRIARLREGMRTWEALWRQLAAEGTLR
jgi:hypothetical protein